MTTTEPSPLDRRTRLIAQRQRSIRTQILATALTALCGAGAVAASMGLDSTQVLASQESPQPKTVTALLSARRVPELLARPVADRRLRALVDLIAADSPPQSCIAVNPRGVTVVDKNASSLVTPASNLKIVTAAVALDVLGPKERFTTRVIAGSEPLNGVVSGPVYLVGGGDPLLETDNYDAGLKYSGQPHTKLESLADAVVAAGVTRIAGDVIGDDDRLDSIRTGPTWPDRYLNEGEAGPLTGLSVNDARVIPGGSQLGRLESPSAATPAVDPAAHGSTVFAELLRARGVVIDGVAKSGAAPGTGQQLAAIDRLTIEESVAQMLRFSDNNTAELLLKEVGLKGKKDPSTAGGIAVATEKLNEWKLPMEGVVLADGSGLDQNNKVTCNLLVKLLERDGALGPLSAGLAIPKENGTLRDRYDDSLAFDNVRAKTGTLSGVTSLSGWVASDKGSHIAFAYVMNMPGESVESSDLRRQEQLTEALTTYPDLPPMNALEPLSALDASGQPIAVAPAPTTTALPLPTTAPVSSDSTDPDSGGTDTDTAGDDIEGEQTNGESADSSTTSP